MTVAVPDDYYTVTVAEAGMNWEWSATVYCEADMASIATEVMEAFALKGQRLSRRAAKKWAEEYMLTGGVVTPASVKRLMRYKPRIVRPPVFLNAPPVTSDCVVCVDRFAHPPRGGSGDGSEGSEISEGRYVFRPSKCVLAEATYVPA